MSPPDLAAAEKFVREMRAIGAQSVSVGDVVVTFFGDDTATASPLAAVTDTTEDPKKLAERLLYSSSD